MNNIRVRVKKVHPNAVIPQYQTKGAAGFDLVAVEDVVIAPWETKLVPTGIAVEIPWGYEMQIRPRSGFSLKTPLRIANAPGTIDSDFRGEVKIIVTNTSENKGFYIKRGDRIAQGVIAPVMGAVFEEADDLSETDRGSGGFGSTGVRG